MLKLTHSHTHTHTLDSRIGVQRATLQPMRSDMYPCELHGVFWSTRGQDRSLIYRRRHPWNPRLLGEMGGMGEEGRREGG